MRNLLIHFKSFSGVTQLSNYYVPKGTCFHVDKVFKNYIKKKKKFKFTFSSQRHCNFSFTLNFLINVLPIYF